MYGFITLPQDYPFICLCDYDNNVCAGDPGRPCCKAGDVAGPLR